MRIRPGKFLRKLQRKLRLPVTYVSSLSRCREYRASFDEVETYCMFVGYPRSGHSLIGSLLDAHPEMIVAHELHSLRYVRYRFDRDQLFYLLLENSRAGAEAGRAATGYSYVVPNQWQGRFRSLRVIGDKRGGTSIRKLAARPQLLHRLRQVVGVPIQFIHVVRNPFDNIATIFRRGESRDLAGATEHYFRMVRGVAGLEQRLSPSDLIHVRHEVFIEDPASELKRLCRFLSVEASEAYLEDCARIVWKSPRQTRRAVDWPSPLIERIQAESDQHPFLKGYGFAP